MTNALLYVLMVLLIALSAYFSGSEIALTACSDIRLKKSAEVGDRRALRAQKLKNDYTRALSTILVGNNLVNIAASSAATVVAMDLFSAKYGEGVANTIAALGMTVLILIFGEIIPKILANEFADNVAPAIAPSLHLCEIVFYPVVSAVTWIVEKIEVLWTPKETAPQVTQDDLYTLLDTIEEEGVFTEKESDLIKSAIEFSDLTAKDILTPRVDVFGLDIEDGVDSLIKDKNVLTYSRIPVYRENMDNIIGILPVKQLLREMLTDPNVDVTTLLTPPVYVHMTRTVSSILKEFRRSKSHMAIVVDEFGGMMGLLTVEDIVEEIVGDIYDERDTVEPELICREDGIYEVDGGMNVYDLFDQLEISDHDFDSEYTTVGGWATEMMDRFPVAGDTFDYKNITVTVAEAQSMRVEKLEVIVHPDETEEED